MTGLTRSLQVMGSEDDATLLKVAFATGDNLTVDQHFGSAKSFAIYGVNQDEVKMLRIAQFGELAQDGNEDKLVHKFKLLEGCIAVYCAACGASALRQLLSIGIQPVKVAEGAKITDLVADLQQELRNGPSSWLAKAMRKSTLQDEKSKFDALASESWDD